jgi:hypothetical protein
MPYSSPRVTGLGSVALWVSPKHNPPADMSRLSGQEGAP